MRNPATRLPQAIAPLVRSVAPILRRRIAVWIAFVLVHIVLAALCLFGSGYPMGDVSFVYRPWALQASHDMSIVGIDRPWVYPIGALLPMLLPLIFGPDAYEVGWLALVTVLNAVALAALLHHPRPRRIAAAWWWLGFLLLLGPIALARIDTVSVAVAMVAVVWLRSRPRVATLLLTAATWIKVWPAALLAALVVASRRRAQVSIVAATTSGIIVALALAFGSGVNILSFVTQQTSRGLQAEATVSTYWMWASAFHVSGSTVYYDRDLLTFQVSGGGVNITTALMTPLLAVAVATIGLLGVRAVQRRAPLTRVLAPLSLALVSTLIVFNKVGSPQFLTWLAVPVVLGILLGGMRFLAPAVLAVLAAALTHAFYPYLYGLLIGGDPLMLGVLTARNVVFVVLLGWSIATLWGAGSRIRATPSVMPAAS